MNNNMGFFVSKIGTGLVLALTVQILVMQANC